MRKTWVVLLTFYILLSIIQFANAEDDIDVFSSPIEEIVVEGEEVDLSDDTDVTSTAWNVNSVNDESIEETNIQGETILDVSVVDEDESEDDSITDTDDIVNNSVPDVVVPENKIMEDEDSDYSLDTVEPDQTVLEKTDSIDIFAQKIDNDDIVEIETELESGNPSDSFFEVELYELGDGEESAEDIDSYSECVDPESENSINMMAAEATTSLQRPNDVDSGYWVNAYRNYMDNTSKYKGYAILADFDLDGIPELLALDENWSHSGISCCYVKYTGNDYIVHEDLYVYDMEGSLYLTFENGSYYWYKSRSYANTGLYDKSIQKLTFSSSMKPTESIRFGLYGDMDKGTEGYHIGSREVSKSEYDQEVAKWNSVSKLLILDPCAFNYPSKWNNAVNQYSVIKKDSNGTTSGTPSADPITNTNPNTHFTISVSKNAKRTVTVGNTYQIDLNGKVGKKYRSSKKHIATVSSTGLITPKSVGKTRITFKVGKKRRTLTLTVKDPTIPTSVSLNMSGTNTVNQGDTVTLTATLPTGTNSGIKWKSNHQSVATVDNGVVRFKKKGSVTITATTTRGKKKAKVKFKVTKYDSKKDLSNYGWRTVTGVTGDNKLTFRKTHTGGYMSNHRFANGERIFVNLTWREGGDAIAYDNGTFGYVQSKYIAW